MSCLYNNSSSRRIRIRRLRWTDPRTNQENKANGNGDERWQAADGKPADKWAQREEPAQVPVEEVQVKIGDWLRNFPTTAK